MSAPEWEFRQPQATLATDACSAVLNVDEPSRGIRKVRLHEHPLPGHLLGVGAIGLATPTLDEVSVAASDVNTLQRVDAYQRLGDIVASYEGGSPGEVRKQIYWRALPTRSPSALAAFELVVSLQTQLLDLYPTVEVTTTLPAHSLWQLAELEEPKLQQLRLKKGDRLKIEAGARPSCFLVRLPGHAYSYAEMLPPADFHAAQMHFATSGQLQIRQHIAAGRLEKGVIRRARVRGVFLPRRRDASAAIAWYRDLLASPLPLTA